MVLFLILFIIVAAAIVLISLFAPEKLPWSKPHLILDRREIEPIKIEPVTRQPIIMEGLAEPESDFSISFEENVARLENIIGEKNRLIEKLQRELTAERSHRTEFEKVKAILDEEI